jgi:hypothetical protein
LSIGQGRRQPPRVKSTSLRQHPYAENGIKSLIQGEGDNAEQIYGHQSNNSTARMRPLNFSSPKSTIRAGGDVAVFGPADQGDLAYFEALSREIASIYLQSSLCGLRKPVCGITL